MGSFVGHVIPGVFFVIYGLWWTVKTNLNYFYRRGASTRQVQHSRNAQKREHELNKRSWLPLPGCPRLALEPFFKVLLPLAGMLGELLVDNVPVNPADASTELNETGTVAMRIGFSPVDLSISDPDTYPVERVQHGTMYMFFVVSGIIDLLSLVVRLPKKTGHIFLSLAFGVEGLLFLFHVGGREMLDVRIHTILVCAIGVCCIAAAARMYSASNLFINSLMCYGLILQGTWFMQAAEVLYGRNAEIWHWSNHHDSMVVSLIAAWHVLGIALFLLIVWFIAHLVTSWRARREGGKGRTSAFLSQRLKLNTFNSLHRRSDMLNGDDNEVELGLLEGEERKESPAINTSATGIEETLEPPQDGEEEQQ